MVTVTAISLTFVKASSVFKTKFSFYPVFLGKTTQEHTTKQTFFLFFQKNACISSFFQNQALTLRSCKTKSGYL